jgi:RNA 3'-terminal phosphate cyclase (ATP)
VLEIDGAFGEGGGQILRTSLALSLITQTPFRVTDIRSRRQKPGLRRQHLTAVRAAASIGQARVTGDAVGSSELTFEPSAVAAGEYHFAISTAGSTALVFQTVLPPLLMTPGRSSVVFDGGTHNTGAPPYDFITKAFLPLLRRIGAGVTAYLERHGFAPAGGGRWSVEVEGGRGLNPLQLHERGDVRSCVARVLLANLPDHIAERETAVFREKAGWPARRENIDADGQGNVVLVEIESDNVTEVFTGFGERGVPAETVAGRALRCARQYLASGAPVGEYLSDQLMIPLALAGGGSYTTIKSTLHATTNAEIIAKFLPVRFAFQPQGGCCRVACVPS